MSSTGVEIIYRCQLCASNQPAFSRRSHWKTHLRNVHELEEEEIKQLEMELTATPATEPTEATSAVHEQTTPATAAIHTMPPVAPSTSVPDEPIEPEIENAGNEDAQQADDAADTNAMDEAAEEPTDQMADAVIPATSTTIDASDDNDMDESGDPSPSFKTIERKRRTPAVQRRQSSAAAARNSAMQGVSDDEDAEAHEHTGSTPSSPNRRDRDEEVKHESPIVRPKRASANPYPYTALHTRSPKQSKSTTNFPSLCHMCGTGQLDQHLECHFSSTPGYIPRGRPCRKRYCFPCITKHFEIDPATTDDSQWVCPACEAKCPCDRCAIVVREGLISQAIQNRLRLTGGGSIKVKDGVQFTKTDPAIVPKVSATAPLTKLPPMVPQFQTRKSMPSAPATKSAANRSSHQPSSSAAVSSQQHQPQQQSQHQQPSSYHSQPSAQSYYIPTFPAESLSLKTGSDITRTVGHDDRHMIVPKICQENTLAVTIKMRNGTATTTASELSSSTPSYPPFSVHFPRAGQVFLIPPGAEYRLANLALNEPYVVEERKEQNDVTMNGQEERKENHSTAAMLKERPDSAPLILIDLVVQPLAQLQSIPVPRSSQQHQSQYHPQQHLPTQQPSQPALQDQDNDSDDDDLNAGFGEQKDHAADEPSDNEGGGGANSGGEGDSVALRERKRKLQKRESAARWRKKRKLESEQQQQPENQQQLPEGQQQPQPQSQQLPSSSTPSATPNKGPSARNVTIPTAERPFQCIQCGNCYTSVLSMRKHQGMVHGHTLSRCNDCHQEFQTARLCRFHRCPALHGEPIPTKQENRPEMSTKQEPTQPIAMDTSFPSNAGDSAAM